MKTISYQPVMDISPNLQLRCSLGQRWLDKISRSRQNENSRSKITCKNSLLRRKHSGRPIAVEDHHSTMCSKKV